MRPFILFISISYSLVSCQLELLESKEDQKNSSSGGEFSTFSDELSPTEITEERDSKEAISLLLTLDGIVKKTFYKKPQVDIPSIYKRPKKQEDCFNQIIKQGTNVSEQLLSIDYETDLLGCGESTLTEVLKSAYDEFKMNFKIDGECAKGSFNTKNIDVGDIDKYTNSCTDLYFSSQMGAIAGASGKDANGNPVSVKARSQTNVSGDGGEFCHLISEDDIDMLQGSCFYATHLKIDGSKSEYSYSMIEMIDTVNNAKSKDPFYNSGSAKIEIDNWSGTINFKGDIAEVTLDSEDDTIKGVLTASAEKIFITTSEGKTWSAFLGAASGTDKAYQERRSKSKISSSDCRDFYAENGADYDASKKSAQTNKLKLLAISETIGFQLLAKKKAKATDRDVSLEREYISRCGDPRDQSKNIDDDELDAKD